MSRMILSPTQKSILKKIESEHAENPVWIVGPEVGKLLHLLIAAVDPKVAFEIGTSVGYSAIWMASGLSGRGHFYSVESHKERHLRAQENLKGAGLFPGKVTLFKAHAPEIFEAPEQFSYALSEIPDQIDFAFFDAIKKDHGRFFEAIFPRLTPEAYVVVDNVQSHREAMETFLEELHKRDDFECIELSIGAGVLIARRQG